MGIFSRNDANATPAKAPAFTETRALTASASRIIGGNKSEAEQFRKRKTSSSSVWQAEAWEYYDAIAEIKFALNIVAHIVSRIRLFAAVIEDVSEAPVPVNASSTIDPQLAAASERALGRIESAYGSQTGLLSAAALNLQIAGECYLVQVPERPAQGLPESWDIRSIDEVQIDPQGNYRIVPRRDLLSNNMYNNASSIVQLPQNAFIGRIWRPHPRFSEEPDSSMRSLLELCDELLLINRTFRGTERSRLNAGMLFLPDGFSVASDPDMDYPYDSSDEVDPTHPQGPTPEESADDFEDNLIEAMVTPIKDEESASSVIPLIVRGPGELGEQIKQFSFARPFDATLATRSETVLDRILMGLDIPKDLVTGFQNVRYNNAVAIDDNLYKAHIEPMVLLISDALTQVYLHPYLISVGYSPAEVQRVVIWFDPSSVATKTDRAADADTGFTNGALSADSWRRAHGFSDGDAPTATEFAMRLLMQKAMLSPQLSEAMLDAISPEIMNSAKAASQAANPAPLPGNVQNILDGGTGATPTPAEIEASGDNAPTPPAGPTTDAASGAEDDSNENQTSGDRLDASQSSSDDSTIPPDSDEPVEPGEDAPPVPLA